MKLVLSALLILITAGSVLTWLIPVEAAQTWVLNRAGPDPFAQFEAVGQMEAAWWTARVLLPALLLLAGWGTRHLDRIELALRNLAADLRQVTQSPADGLLTRWVFRTLIVLWALLFLGHLGGSFRERAREWPYFRLRAGADVLPNISDTNRDIIRYVRAVTPPESRILVFSDQKLFFLSYYLLPRRLFHFTHPDAEFNIPRANQPDQYQAYRREDVSPEEIARLQPDYILEYFEGEAFIDDSRRARDPAWVRFWQATHGSEGLPPYQVVLSPVEGETP